MSAFDGRKTAQLLDGRAIGVTTLQHVDLAESSVWSLQLQWRHGIYGTTETHRVTVIVDCVADEIAELLDDAGEQFVDAFVVDDGAIRPLTIGDERDAVLGRHIVAVVTL